MNAATEEHEENIHGFHPTFLDTGGPKFGPPNRRVRRPGKRLSGPASIVRRGGLLTLFYFDQETTGDDPQQDRIITVQLRQLDENLEPVGSLQIMAEWEWGEKQIIQMALEKGVLQPNWDFVPVGNRLRFDLTFLIERATKWDLIKWDLATLKYFWYTKPLLDLQPILILMNRGKFTGSSLQAFADKAAGARVPGLYRKGAYSDIIAYVTREQDAALEVLREARKVLSDLGDARRRPPP